MKDLKRGCGVVPRLSESSNLVRFRFQSHLQLVLPLSFPFLIFVTPFQDLSCTTYHHISIRTNFCPAIGPCQTVSGPRTNARFVFMARKPWGLICPIRLLLLCMVGASERIAREAWRWGTKGHGQGKRTRRTVGNQKEFRVGNKGKRCTYKATITTARATNGAGGERSGHGRVVFWRRGEELKPSNCRTLRSSTIS